MSAAQDPEVERIWSELKARPSDMEPRRRLGKLLSEKGHLLGELLTLTLMTDEEFRARRQEYERAGHSDKFVTHWNARVEALLREHGNTWFPKHPDDPFGVDMNTVRGRGMPESLGLFNLAKAPLEKLAWFTARYPLRRLTIGMKDPAPVIDALEAGGHFERIEDLTFVGNHWSPAAIEALHRASPGTPKVSLNEPTLAASDWPSLLSARVFAKTTRLGLVKTSLEEKAFGALWTYFPKLEELYLYHARPQAIPGLGTKPLRGLAISGPWGSNQVIALMEGLQRSSVQRLELKEEAGSTKAIRWIADEALAGRFANLEELVLQESWLDDTHAKVLAESLPRSLRILDLDRSPCFSEKGVAALAELANSGRCPKLEAIRLWGISIGKSGDDRTVAPRHEVNLTLEEIRQKFGFPAGLKLK